MNNWEVALLFDTSTSSCATLIPSPISSPPFDLHSVMRIRHIHSIQRILRTVLLVGVAARSHCRATVSDSSLHRTEPTLTHTFETTETKIMEPTIHQENWRATFQSISPFYLSFYQSRTWA